MMDIKLRNVDEINITVTNGAEITINLITVTMSDSMLFNIGEINMMGLINGVVRNVIEINFIDLRISNLTPELYERRKRMSSVMCGCHLSCADCHIDTRIFLKDSADRYVPRRY